MAGTWTGHHPDWALRLWTEENLPEGLRRPEVHELLRQPAERADILRLELLHREGGVYVDVDVECLRPIDPLLDGVACFAGRLDSGRITNTVLGLIQQVVVNRLHPIVPAAAPVVAPVEPSPGANGRGGKTKRKR